MPEFISENIRALQACLTRAAQNHGRAADAVKLMAVSKTQPPENIDAALAAGQRLFGENRVQEAQTRWAARRAAPGADPGTALPDLRLHLIGPLQTNKVADAVALFDCIETVDRPKLVDALALEMRRQGRVLPCLIQVNIGGEPQKAGVPVDGLPGLLDHCRQAGLKIVGLMCIPPEAEPPAPHFALLRQLARWHDLPELSMGMSGDFEWAVALGATQVRVGSALFGAQNLAF